MHQEVELEISHDGDAMLDREALAAGSRRTTQT
jgi:hypothetical protein